MIKKLKKMEDQLVAGNEIKEQAEKLKEENRKIKR
jgi:hypothetical protein